MKNRQPLSIAMLTDAWFPFWGGGQVHVLNLSQTLAATYNCQVKIFHPPHHHIIIRLIWTLLAPFQIALYHYHHPLNLIHSHGYNSGLAGKLASLLINRPIIHTIHGSNLLDQHSTGLRANLEKWLLTGIQYTAQITVSSTFLSHPNVNTHIHLIPNGVDIKAFDSISSNPNPHPTLIWVGRIQEPLKGFKYLHQSLKKIRQQVPDLQVEVVTGGRLTGQELIKAYKRAHIFVLPSLSEGQPITLLEAWAAKLPVVVTKVGDNPNMVKDHKNGLLIPPGNVHALTQAIIYLLKHPRAARIMGSNGYRTVASSYDWSIITSRTHSLYLQILNLQS